VKQPIRRTLASTALATFTIAGMLSLTGCDPKPKKVGPIKIRVVPTSAEELGGGLKDSKVETDSGKIISGWPKACDLLTDETIKALLPQVKGVTRVAKDKKYRIAGGLSNGGVFTVKGATCQYNLDLPVGVLRKNEPNIYIVTDAANFYLNGKDANLEPRASDPRNGACKTDGGNDYGCRSKSGRFSYTVSVNMPWHSSTDDPEIPSPYDDQGTITKFSLKADDDSKSGGMARLYYVSEHMAAPLAKSVLKRLNGL
jgi:hypothetical protein